MTIPPKYHPFHQRIDLESLQVLRPRPRPSGPGRCGPHGLCGPAGLRGEWKEVCHLAMQTGPET